MYGEEVVSVRLIVLTASLVACMGLVLLFSVLTWNPYSHAEAQAGGRHPAGLLALDPVESRRKPLPENTEVIDLDCVQQMASRPLSSAARLVRLKGQICASDHWGVLSHSQILNRTNGFVATTFHLERNHFTSDYMELVKGPNQIFVNLVNAKGENWEREITILRQ